MDTASPTMGSRNLALDSPPPQPPAANRGGFFPPSSQDNGIGELANSPQIMTMQGLAMVKDAFQLISNGQPMLATILQNTMQDLEQLIAQTMAAAPGQQPGPLAPPPVGPGAMGTPGPMGQAAPPMGPPMGYPGQM